MAFKKWQIANINKELAKELAEECDIDPFIALVSASRGYCDAVTLLEYLGEECFLGEIYDLPDMERAVRTIKKSISDGEKIAVYGDYDCDGITATAIVYRFLKECGAEPVVYIPDRINEGYGMTVDGIDKLISLGVKLIITVDNGISCINEVEYAREKGVKVVITDHHLPAEELPAAEAIVNPHLVTSCCEFKDISGSMVAFRLVCALADAECEEMLEYYGELAVIGTIADVMPLLYENRAMLKAALPFIKKSKVTGILALAFAAGIRINEIDEQKIAFGIVPRINAAGRLGSAMRAFDLLVCEDSVKAEELATEICQENANRQQIEKDIYAQAVKIIETKELHHNRVIVVWGENWHLGVLGIVAAKICDKYAKPTIVLSSCGDFYCGSGRSLKGFSLFNAVNECAWLLHKFGGHELAAGVTIKEENLKAFSNEINSVANKMPTVCPLLNLDCKLNPAFLSVDLVHELKQLEPYGHANPVPVFGIFGVKVERVSPIGNNKHIRIMFSKGEISFSAVMFNISKEAFCFNIGDIVDIAVTLDVNLRDGKEYFSVVIKDIRPMGVEDDNVMAELALYDDFCAQKSGDFLKIKPTREEFAAVYKYIAKNNCLADGVVLRFAAQISPAKTKVILKALKELNLAETAVVDGTEFLKIVPATNKVDLAEAEIIKRFEN